MVFKDVLTVVLKELTVPWVVHEVSKYGFVVSAVNVAGQQCVLAVVDMCRVVELQAAVILVLGVIVDPGADESPFRQRFTT